METYKNVPQLNKLIIQAVTALFFDNVQSQDCQEQENSLENKLNNSN